MLDFIDRDAQEVFEEEFLDFAGYNLQRRALPDARDGCKWGARKLLHAQYLAKLTFDKPFKKATKSVAQATSFSYTHGPASAYGTLIRMAKPFAYRVPLQEANGNYGTLMNPNDHSADRYVELRGSEAAYQLLKDLEKDTIDEWEDTYDMEGKFPKVLPAKGFWNGVNGCISIGSGMSSSLPPLNLKETNEAMIRLLWNPGIADDEILCYPDFPTGATLLNKSEVRESLLHGNGAACKIRANVEWDDKDRCFIVREMPYSTFTNTICKELAELIENDENCGIKDFADYTGEKPDLRIFISKSVSPEKALKYIYKNTSLETFFAINMTVLDKGLYPVVMSQRQLFQAHLDHEKKVYVNGFQFDRRKILVRLHILEALIKAISMIDEVVKIIKQSSDTKSASTGLQKLLNIDETQAKAILDLKLSRLTHLDVSKLEDEQISLNHELARIEAILNDESLLKKEIEKGLREVAEKFGDDRRTKILNLSTNDEDEVIEEKKLQLSLTNENAIYISESSTLFTQRRGGVGNKIKLDKGEYIISSSQILNTDSILFFTNNGEYYNYYSRNLPINEKIYLNNILSLKDGQQVKGFSSLNKNNQNSNIIFITKNGYLKKSALSEYNTNRTIGIKALTLEPGDEIVEVLFTQSSNVGILTNQGNFLVTKTNDVRPIGRVSRGIHGIKLNLDDFVVSAHCIPSSTKEIISITKNGLTKRTSYSEFSIQGKNTKGAKIQKIEENDYMSDFAPIATEKDCLITGTNSCIKISLSEVSLLSKNSQGTKAIKLKENEKVIGISLM